MIRNFYLILFYLIIWIPGSSKDSIVSKLRLWLCTKLGADIGRGCAFLPYAEIFHLRNFSLGDNSGVGTRCIINCEGKVSIGNKVLIGPEVFIFTANHIWNEELNTYFQQGATTEPVTISDNVWLGARCIILPGVHVGEGATVAAGAVVTKNVASYAVVAGVPASVIGFKKHR